MDNIEQILISKDQTLRLALKKLDESGKSILLLVDSLGVLLRTITDGDIRRLLLDGKELDDSLNSLEKNKPIVIDFRAENAEILEIMDKHEVYQVPLVNDGFMPIDVFFRSEIQPRIQLSIPHMGDHEISYIEEAFQTNWIAPLGPNVDAFEEELTKYLGIKCGAALSSGTAAIHLALRLLDVGPKDIVFSSSFTFVASANPILYQYATPVFIDSEPETWNMSVHALENALDKYSNEGNLPKAIIVVHLYGLSANMEKIIAVANSYGVPVIEDAAESLGAKYNGKQTGTYGKFGIYSFNGNKIITTSGGGMLVSDDDELIAKARFLSTQARNPAPYYEHSEIGYNYRMSNVLAGIGRGQLRVLDDRVNARRAIFDKYRQGLSHFDCIEWMPEPIGSMSNRWLSVMLLNPEKTRVNPKEIIRLLGKANIEARHVWKPMHLQPLFKACEYFMCEDKSFSDYLFQTAICLPSASNMTSDQQEQVIKQISKIIKNASVLN